jgi:hypothetical protein
VAQVKLEGEMEKVFTKSALARTAPPENFLSLYRESFMDSCTGAAVDSGSSALGVELFCSCLVGDIIGALSYEEIVDEARAVEYMQAVSVPRCSGR